MTVRQASDQLLDIVQNREFKEEPCKFYDNILYVINNKTQLQGQIVSKTWSYSIKITFNTQGEGFFEYYFVSKHALFVGYEEDTICVGLSRVGCDDQNIVCTTLKKMKETDIGAPLHSLVIPGKLHFLEIEMLKLFADGSDILETLERIQKDTKR